MIFLHFARLFRLSVRFGVILYLGAINCILVWSLCLGYIYFLYICFFFIPDIDFHFYTFIYSVLHMDRLSCCDAKKSWIRNIIFLVQNNCFGVIFYVLNFFLFGIPYTTSWAMKIPIYHQWLLSHWGWDKMANIFPDNIFKCIFFYRNV